MEEEGVDWLLDLLQQVSHYVAPLTLNFVTSGSTGAVLCPNQGWTASIQAAAFWVCPIRRSGEDRDEQAGSQEAAGHHQEEEVEEQTDQVLAHCRQVRYNQEVGGSSVKTIVIEQTGRQLVEQRVAVVEVYIQHLKLQELLFLHALYRCTWRWG